MKFLLLVLSVILIIAGLIYLIRIIYKIQKGIIKTEHINKTGLLAAIGAIVLGIFLIYRNAKKNQ